MAPYGYRIAEGEAVREQEEYKQVRNLFLFYIQGSSIKSAAEESGIPYSVAKRALSNPVYKGTDFYPGIVDEDLFYRVQEKRKAANSYRRRSICESGRKSGSGSACRPRRRQSQPVRVRNRFRISPRLLSAGIPPSETASSWIYRHIRAGREEIISDSIREAVFALYRRRYEES